MQYAWLVWSLMLLAVWIVVYCSLRNADSRKEMLIVSLWTSLLGLGAARAALCARILVATVTF